MLAKYEEMGNFTFVGQFSKITVSGSYQLVVTLLLQTKTQLLEHIETPMLVFPLQTVCQMRNFDNQFRLGAFLSIYDTLIECSRNTWEIRPVYTRNTRILVRVYKTMVTVTV